MFILNGVANEFATLLAAIQSVVTGAIDLKIIKWKEPTGPFSHGNINRQLSVISRPSRFRLETLGTPGRSLSTTQADLVTADWSDLISCTA
ncbi:MULTISPECIES: hypothetical protein [Pseudomonas]|uniref:Uncharacterized protein n=1 Tax=Pseudomonas reactans TaxID=117680 RepID=A0A7Y8KLE6_9PSED|nr:MULTISPECIES: hypothetical protein [Pseudomonas]MCK8654654.1 hypothetical protein [Pseudomonas umsongensis]NWA45989.1 hypothetical protein [Pseudomonas reactans]NWD98318.1 hypothetical protein [Pseudomonas reactans]NWE92979.1 hypothetical protein [Pseudomonas reactans]